MPDQSFQDRASVNPKKFYVPYERNHYFCGRKEEIEKIHQTLCVDSSAVISQSIAGLGGVGKTQTAIEYVYLYSLEEPIYEWVFWVRADSDFNLTTDISKIAYSLGLGQEQDNLEKLGQLVCFWLETHECWLLIFDNSDQPELINPYRPRQGKGRILLTSRARLFDCVGINQSIPLREWSETDAVEFLWNRIHRKLIEQSPKEIQAAHDLVKKLGAFPLALEQAGAYILELEVDISDYYQEYYRLELLLLEEQKPVVGDYRDSVRTTWTLNFQQVAERSPASAAILQLSAFLAPDEIPNELIMLGVNYWGDDIKSALTGVSNLSLAKLLKPLADYSLIRVEREKQCYGIHRMVQVVVRHELTEKEHFKWKRSLVIGLYLAFEETSLHNWKQYERLLPHVKSLAELNPTDSLAWSLVLSKVGYHLGRKGCYIEAVNYIELSLNIQKRDGQSQYITAENLMYLGEFYGCTRQFRQAEILFQKASYIYSQNLPPLHPTIATVSNNFAELYFLKGDFPKALLLLQHALNIYTKNLLLESPRALETICNLANCHQRMGHYSDAEPILLKALKICKEKVCIDYPNIFQCLNNLGDFYNDVGRHAEAKTLLEESLAIVTREFGKGHLLTAISLGNLAFCHESLGNYQEAEFCCKQALNIRK